MIRFYRALVVSFIVAWGVVGLMSECKAQGVVILSQRPTVGTGITNAVLSGSPVTDCIKIPNNAAISFTVSLDRTAASTVTMTCREYSGNTSTCLTPVVGAVRGAALHVVVDTSSTTGVSKTLASTWSTDVSGDAIFTWTVRNISLEKVQCTFGGSGATADTISVSGHYITP